MLASCAWTRARRCFRLSRRVGASGAYLVPRPDGRLLVGATVEEKGFDPHLTAGAQLALLQAAWRALPGIEELPVDEAAWSRLPTRQPRRCADPGQRSA